jgi:hypothetical protein
LVLREYVFSAWSSDYAESAHKTGFFVYVKYLSDFCISYRRRIFSKKGDSLCLRC